MFTQIPAVDFPLADAYRRLRPLARTDRYLARYKNGADAGLRVASSDGTCLTEFMPVESALSVAAFIDGSPYAICLGRPVIIHPGFCATALLIAPASVEA